MLHGHRPGIYEKWDECKEQTQGFPDALYKGFDTRYKAQLYVERKLIIRNGKWFAVTSGTRPGIYSAWSEFVLECKVHGPCDWKSFSSEEDAKAYVAEYESAQTRQDATVNDITTPAPGRISRNNEVRASNEPVISNQTNGDVAAARVLLPSFNASSGNGSDVGLTAVNDERTDFARSSELVCALQYAGPD